MPKMKSHSGAKKRFRKTATGKWQHRKPGLRHMLTGMKAKKGRLLRETRVIEKTHHLAKVLDRNLPYE